MTGPTSTASWMNFDLQSNGRSEAWSELLGLPANPRHTSGPLFGSASLQGPIAAPLFPEASGSTKPVFPELEAEKAAAWLGDRPPYVRRMSFDSASTSYQRMSGSRKTQYLSPVASETNLQSQAHRFCNGISPVASQGILQLDPYQTRTPVSPVLSHSIRQLDGTRRLGGLSPVPSEAVIQHEAYRRAALDFVLELAGPPQGPAAGAANAPPPDLIAANDLPIPAFAVDRDVQLCMWNRQLAELSGWDEADVVRGAASPNSLLLPRSGNGGRSRSCVEQLRSVLFGVSPPTDLQFWVKAKDRRKECRRETLGTEACADCGKRWPACAGPNAAESARCVLPGEGHIPVELRLARRTDAVGAVCGVLCVVVPLKLPATSAASSSLRNPCPPGPSGTFKPLRPFSAATARQLEPCSSKPFSDRSRINSAKKATHNYSWHTVQSGTSLDEALSSRSSSSGSGGAGDGRPCASGTAAFGPSSLLMTSALPSPASSSSLGSPSLSAPASASSPTPSQAQPSHSHSVCSYSPSAAAAQELNSKAVRALVMDSVDAVRMELAQNLERCGLDVVSCGSLGEAVWRFERSLADPCDGPRFDIIFLELQPNCDELFLAIRDLRRMEEEAKILAAPPVALPGATLASFKIVSAGESPREQCALPRIPSKDRLETSQDNLVAAGARVVEVLEEDDEDEDEAVPASKKPPVLVTEDGALDECDSLKSPLAEAEPMPEEGIVTMPAPEGQDSEKRCLILAVVNLNRWDLAGLDAAMEQCVRAGGDVVIPRSMQVQQLKAALRKLGVRSKYLTFPSRLPRALSGTLHNPLNITR